MAGKTQKVEYATTRGWTYPNRAEVDATDEVKAAYQAWKTARAAKAKADYHEELAKMPKVGQSVRIIGGRKLPKGTIAEITWVGLDTFKEQASKRYSSGWEEILPFKYYADKYRVGLRLNDGKRVFVSAAHIEAI